QVKAGEYRIDLIVEGHSHRLAIECDGDHWHGPDRYQQDMQRQRQLERAGWRFVRVRESEFYANPSATIQRIVDACARMGIAPVLLGLTDSTPDG
ncbi:MAG: DUF559 domain-containing protein, partial [Armatimonadetes bacterium]